MASRKSYAYQIKGNKISLIQNQFGYGSGQDIVAADGSNKQFSLSEAGPTGKPSWISPNESVTDGIEVEYAYSPKYSLPVKRSDSGSDDTYHTYSGWFVVDGYLTLGATFKNFTVHSGIAVDSHILIEGSDRWNGTHRVQSIQHTAGGSHGGVQTYTKVSQTTKYFTDDAANWTSSETIVNISTAFDNVFSASPGDDEYIWLAGSDITSGVNNGLYSGWSFSGTTIDVSAAVVYTITDGAETLSVPSYAVDGPHALYVYEAFREKGAAKFYSEVSVLEDESFELDLPVYLAKALVYYIKAKLAEDQQNIEVKEYLMREFKRLVEKHESSKISGPRRIMGFGMTR